MRSLRTAATALGWAWILVVVGASACTSRADDFESLSGGKPGVRGVSGQ
jgi:hypothetical protein